MDFYELGKDLKYIGSQLETIRKLTKGKSVDFNKKQYANDAVLLQHLLHEKIMELMNQAGN